MQHLFVYLTFKIQVWNSKLLIDKFMGECIMKGNDNPFENSTREERSLDLHDRGKNREELFGGKIKILIESYNDVALS